MYANELGRWVWRLLYSCVYGCLSTVVVWSTLGRDRSFSPLTKGRRKGDTIIISQMRTQTRWSVRHLAPKEDLPQRDWGTFLRSYLELQSSRSFPTSCMKWKKKLKVCINYKAGEGGGEGGRGGNENTEHKQAHWKIWKGIKKLSRKLIFKSPRFMSAWNIPLSKRCSSAQFQTRSL